MTFTRRQLLALRRLLDGYNEVLESEIECNTIAANTGPAAPEVDAIVKRARRQRRASEDLLIAIEAKLRGRRDGGRRP